jgi:hypothetical protein
MKADKTADIVKIELMITDKLKWLFSDTNKLNNCFWHHSNLTIKKSSDLVLSGNLRAISMAKGASGGLSFVEEYECKFIAWFPSAERALLPLKYTLSFFQEDTWTAGGIFVLSIKFECDVSHSPFFLKSREIWNLYLAKCIATLHTKKDTKLRTEICKQL